MTKTTGNILSAIAFSALFVLCLSFAAIRVLGLGTYIVTGGSMEPGIHKGALVFVQPIDPTQVKLGDVITFQQYGQTTTHRVIAIGQNPAGHTFKTQGDANVVADPEDKTFTGQVGIVRLSVPVAGYAAAQVQAYWRLALTLLAAISFFACAGTLVLRKERASSPAPVRDPRVVRRPAPVGVDADEAWHTHLAWLRSRQRQALA